MVCTRCPSTHLHGLHFRKIPCVGTSANSVVFGAEKGGYLDKTFRVFCPRNYPYLPRLPATTCSVMCEVPVSGCFRCDTANFPSCFSCIQGYILDGSVCRVSSIPGCARSRIENGTEICEACIQGFTGPSSNVCSCVVPPNRLVIDASGIHRCMCDIADCSKCQSSTICS